MGLYENIVNGSDKVSVVGLGCVGIPLAIAFSKVVKVIGYDISEKKVSQYNNSIDLTGEIGDEALHETTAVFTSDEKKLKEARFHIVAVPTPVRNDKTPDLSLVENASRLVGRNLVKGSIVVYESTVYPGVTEDVCVPILEEQSGLICGTDFKVGYSPERINPGDKVHRLETITKIVSGMDPDSLDTISKVFELVVGEGVFRAESIKVAEAAKVIENSQRDINIAFMNELSIIFNLMGIDMKAVLAAAKTKWNFLNFHPGLVGGHCIGIDPYYLTYCAEMNGYHSKIILSGRTINDDMAKYIAEQAVKQLISSGVHIKGAKVAVWGVTFKENCPDVRNSKVMDVIKELAEYGIECILIDSVADSEDFRRLYGKELTDRGNVSEVDGCLFAVAHDDFRGIKLEDLKSLYRNEARVLIDLMGIFDREAAEKLGFGYWRL